MRKIIFIILAFIFSAGCNFLQKKGCTGRIVDFREPDIPGSITDLDDRLDFFAMNYWNNFTEASVYHLCDSSHTNGVPDEELDKAFETYISTLWEIDNDEARKSIRNTEKLIGKFMKKHPESNMYETMAKLFEKHAYDVKSPFRNEDFYLEFLNGAIKSKFITEKDRQILSERRKICLHNRVGKIIGNISFVDENDIKKDLYDIKAENILLILGNELSPEYEDLMKRISDNMIINNHEGKGDLKIVNIYTGDDRTGWRNLSRQYTSWINGTAINKISGMDTEYFMRHSPVMYLIDEEKRVLAKDSSLKFTIKTLLKESD